MIEFKAECGHTVRAKDEDAGKVVRCSYCGREAQVPDKSHEEGDLDFLLSEVERTGVYEAESDRDRRRRMQAKRRTKDLRRTRKASKISGFDPFAFVLKLCYVGLIAVVLIFVGKTVLTYLQESKKSPPRPSAINQPSQPGTGVQPSEPPPGARGLIHHRLPPGRCGIYVDSVPTRADVYIARAGSITGSIFRTDEALVRLSSGECHEVDLSEGSDYDVYMAVRLSSPALMDLEGYEPLRRSIERQGSDAGLTEYFLPDGAVDVMTDTPPNRPTMIVRRYRCRVFKGSWSPVVALFLPRDLTLHEVVQLLPPQHKFGFDKEEVHQELRYQQIPVRDHQDMIQMLYRIGTVPYRREDGSYRIFRINLVDGALYEDRVSAALGVSGPPNLEWTALSAAVQPAEPVYGSGRTASAFGRVRLAQPQGQAPCGQEHQGPADPQVPRVGSGG
jgi:hypothetical protein